MSSIIRLLHSVRGTSSWPAALALATAALGLATLGGCASSSGDSPAYVVATIGGVPITRSTLDHWMVSFTGGDFFEHHPGVRAPLGLVSDPPDYHRCVASAERFAATPAGHGSVSDPARLDEICHKLYLAIKEQVLSFLISVQWRVDEAAAMGIRVTGAGLQTALKRVLAQQFPRPGEFATYLADREWVRSDEVYQLKRNVLTARMLEVIHRKHGPGIRGELYYIKLVQANAKKLKTKTSCRAGYVVPECRQFKGKPLTPANTSADLLLEELTSTA